MLFRWYYKWKRKEAKARMAHFAVYKRTLPSELVKAREDAILEFAYWAGKAAYYQYLLEN